MRAACQMQFESGATRAVTSRSRVNTSDTRRRSADRTRVFTSRQRDPGTVCMTSRSAPTSLPLCLYTLRRLSSGVVLWDLCFPLTLQNSQFLPPCSLKTHLSLCHLSFWSPHGWLDSACVCVCVSARVCDLLDTAQLQPSFWPHYFTLHPSLLLPAPHNLCLLRFPSSLFTRPPPGRCPPLHPYLSRLLRRGMDASLLRRLS